jgi:hypothetical protein
MTWMLVLAAAITMQAAGPAKIGYSKTFPGSVPPYAAIWVDQDGKGEFHDSPDGELPVKFQLTPAERDAIFSLAAKLNHFSRPLDSGLKVAFTGEKVFRFEQGDIRREVKFNYTQDADAQALLDWFERLTETSMHVITLERTIRFDRLGLDKALLQLQISADKNRLVAASQLLPLLDRIARNQATFNRVRERAAALAEAIRAAQPRSD